MMKRLYQNSPPNNALKLYPGRKGHSRGSVRWVIGILKAGMVVFASLLLMLYCGVVWCRLRRNMGTYLNHRHE
jgi:hypothetical protein